MDALPGGAAVAGVEEDGRLADDPALAVLERDLERSSVSIFIQNHVF